MQSFVTVVTDFPASPCESGVLAVGPAGRGEGAAGTGLSFDSGMPSSQSLKMRTHRSGVAEPHKRGQAIHRKEGASNRLIGCNAWLGNPAACKTLPHHDALGPMSRASRRRDRTVVEWRTQIAAQGIRLQALTRERRPLRSTMGSALWTRPPVRRLIECACGISRLADSVGQTSRAEGSLLKPIRHATNNRYRR